MKEPVAVLLREFGTIRAETGQTDLQLFDGQFPTPFPNWFQVCCPPFESSLRTLSTLETASSLRPRTN